MGVIATDAWLEEEYDQPARLCKRAKPDVKDSQNFYRYLCQFGMYQKNDDIKQLIMDLKKNEVWKKIGHYYKKYKQKWRGPEVNIYIFPIHLGNAMFRERLKQRSGLAFKDTIFLFIGHTSDIELEAQFVHEYHHSVRMNKLKKKAEDYTLLDSLVFEGLAEHAVLFYCGEKCTLNLDKQYNEHDLEAHWRKMYKRNINITRDDPLHDRLLFGPKQLPMLGYAVGERIIHQYLATNKLSIHETFTIQSERLI